MDKGLRKSNFRFGCIHGKIEAVNNKSEAAIQRKVFSSPGIEINWSRHNKERIRLFGYEIPLLTGANRVNCVDLMGYNKEYELYIIELKKKDSPEKLNDINNQINDYASKVSLSDIEQDFKDVFLFDIKYKSIKKLILAPREFLEKNKGLRDQGIIYGHYKDRDITTRCSHSYIQIHLEK
jgi:hypothetical protein